MEIQYLLLTLSGAAVTEQIIGDREEKAKDEPNTDAPNTDAPNTDEPYSIELEDTSGFGRLGRYQELVESRDCHSGCTFFYQAEKAAKELYGEKQEPQGNISRVLSQYVVFFNCRHIPLSADGSGDNPDEQEADESSEHRKLMLSAFRDIVKNGLKIRFAKNGGLYHFRVSDRSSSMSRNGKITLVRADRPGGGGPSLYDALEESLMLGMDFSGLQVNPSKYYAYRGLYLTDSTRLDTAFGTGPEGELRLNEETVIVIPDDLSPGKDMTVVTSSLISGDLWGAPETTVLDKRDKRAEINRFDGEGLICPGYSELVNEQLYAGRYAGRYNEKSGGKKEHISSFQIRLPMGKGMLHEADFHAILKDMLAKSLYDRDMSGLTAEEESYIEARYLELEVEDQFKIKRKISKARIVLTASMFKANRWLKEYCKQKEISDPMKLYFEGMEKYGHSLYIANDSSVIGKDDVVPLNYQFLNTLKLDETALRKLVCRHAALAGRIVSLDEKDAAANGEDAVADIEYDSGERLIRRMPGKFRQAAAEDKRFLKEKRVAQILGRNRRGMLYDIARGRLLVEGKCRFLSRDLLALVVYIAKLINDVMDPEKLFDTIALRKLCLPNDTVYMPSYRPPEKDKHRQLYRAMLRSPHLSRNEQCYVRLFRGGANSERYKWYKRYFSGLSGVVMVNYGSLCPTALAGADFDGDLVKIISDEDVVNAVRDGIGACDTGIRIERTLPVILIPSLEQKNSTIGKTVDFEVLAGSLSTRVGIISNKAIALGKNEYGNDEARAAAFADKCAESTILVGLEIDSVKTGRKPDLSEYLRFLKKQKLDSRSGRDPYLEKKDELGSVPDAYRTAFVTGKDSEGNERIAVKAYGKTGSVRITESKYRPDAPVLDMLPWLYLCESRGLAEAGENDPAGTGDIRGLLVKQPPEGMDLSAKDEKELRERFRGIVEAYCGTLAKASRDYENERQFERSRFYSKIQNILRQQYDGVYAPYRKDRPEDGTVYNKAAEAYDYVGGCLIDRESAGNCLDRMIAEHWEYTPKNVRGEKLRGLLGAAEGDVPEDIADMLCRFDYSGYRLLYYMVKNMYLFGKGLPRGEQPPEDEAGSGNPVKDEYLSEYKKIYAQAVSSRTPGKLWGEELCGRCRSDIVRAVDSVVEGDAGEAASMDAALWLYTALPACADPHERFLWDIFSVSEIKRRMVPEKEKAEPERNN